MKHAPNTHQITSRICVCSQLVHDDGATSNLDPPHSTATSTQPHCIMALLQLPLLLLAATTTTLTQAQSTAPTCRNNNAALPLPAETIFQFAPGRAGNFTFFENIAARANGDLLVTMAVPQPNVFLLQNSASACPTLSPLFSVPGVNGTNGIVEIATRPDVFAVIAGNLSLSAAANGVPDSWSVWEIDLSRDANSNTMTVNCDAGSPPPPPPTNVTARKIASVPQAPRLNGAAAIPGTAAILMGDSQLGVAFRLDTITGAVTTALDFPQMKPVPGAGSIDDALGLNGMKITASAATPGNESLFLYFTNAAARTMNRVAILPDGTGPVSGAAVEMIASVPSAGWMDDLDVRSDGSLWVTTNVSCIKWCPLSSFLQHSALEYLPLSNVCDVVVTSRVRTNLGNPKVPTNSLLAIEPTMANSTGMQAQFMAPVAAVGSPNLTMLNGPTSAVFGRGNVSNRFLFVACGDGNEPARIVRVDTTSCQ